ncbi:MAG: NAD-dependent epimerase/dehydratase family protein [Candidatus Omnitrophica bacterium]|nr:NAD-dependent epimerase/dehydratase family protein [Candidatus Omnitrophota bacterium]
MTDVLVTGGTGFIGAYLVRGLVSRYGKVRVFDNDFRGSISNLADISGCVELIQGDIRDINVVRRAVDGIKTVYHLAFVNGTEHFYKQPKLVLDVGVRGTMNILDAAIEQGVSNFIFASSSEVYQTPTIIPTPESVSMSIPDPLNSRYSYAGGKLIGELLTLHYTQGSSMRRIIFRPHNIYGPCMGWEHVVPQLLRKIGEASDQFRKKEAEIVIQGSGKETRAFCFIEDAVEGILLCAQKGQDGNIYHLGKDEEVSILDLVSKIAAILGIKVHLQTSPLMAGGTPRRCPDISRLKTLGYNPKISLDEGLRRTVEWYKERLLHDKDKKV